MEELLTLARGLPQRSVAAGDAVIEKGGQLITTVTEPGACIDEIELAGDGGHPFELLQRVVKIGNQQDLHSQRCCETRPVF
jgi:hypothetical protein